MIRRNTWILLLVLAALVGFSFYLRDSRARQAAAATPTSGSVSLFASTDGPPSGIKISDSTGVSVEFARDQNGAWVVKAPTKAAANQASAEAAATQVGALRVLASVALGPDIVGLDKPGYTLTISFGANKTRKLVIGSATPIEDGYYTQLDGGPVQIVDKGGLDALLSLLTSPPYLSTLTPVATVTPSPEPATPTAEGTLPAAGSAGGTTTATVAP